MNLLPKLHNIFSRSISATVRPYKGRFKPTRQALVLTQTAINKIKDLSKEQESLNLTTILRISVRQRGCNGMSYTLEFDDKKEKFDEVVNQDGVQITIDSKAQLTLLGTEMDYMEDRLSSQFVFNNPNIKGTCGCGESFNIWYCFHHVVLQSPSVRGVHIGKFELIPFRRVALYTFILNTKTLFFWNRHALWYKIS